MVAGWSRLSALLGVAWFATLIALMVVSSSAPGSGASNAAVYSWVHGHAGTAKAIGWLTLVSVLVALGFFAAFRSFLLRRSGVEGLATLGFAGGAIFCVGLMMELGSYWGGQDQIAHLSAGGVGSILAVVSLGQLMQDFGIAALTLSSGLAILRSDLLPRWVGWLSILVGIAAAIPVIDPIGALAFVVWALCVSVVLYLRWDAPAVVSPVATPVTRNIVS